MAVATSSTDYCKVFRSSIRLARAFAESLYTGLSRSREKGLGLEYVDFRDYVYGDDIRHVDWRLSARSLTPEGDIRLIVKVFQAERMIDTVLAVDLTASMGFKSKPWVIAYTTTILGFLAESLEDKITLVLLGDKPRIIKPSSPKTVPAIIETAVCRGAAFKGKTSLEDLAITLRNTHHRPVVVVTDYAHTRKELFGFLKSMRARRNRVYTIVAVDPYEVEPPLDNGVLRLVSPETGRSIYGKISVIYDKINKHVRELRTIARLYSTQFIELRGREGSIIQRYRIVRGYLHVRSGLRHTFQ